MYQHAPATIKGLYRLLFKKEEKPKKLVDKLQVNQELFFTALEEVFDGAFTGEINNEEFERRLVHLHLGAAAQ